jgi:outer membrane immunogenic protein
MKKFGLAMLTFAALTTVAAAADLPMKAPAYAPPVLSTWTGFYVGLNGGYGWASRDHLGDATDDPCCVRPNGWFGGAQIGYNYQINAFVLGVEADFQGADISKTINDLNFGDTLHAKIDWFGTVRGRLGYVVSSPLLVYVTGGFAYGHVNNAVSGPVLTGSPYNIDRVASGYTVGGGVEYKLTPNWSVKGEYQYINLGKNAPTNPAGQPYDQFPSTFVRDTDFHTVRIGFNYLFGP